MTLLFKRFGIKQLSCKLERRTQHTADLVTGRVSDLDVTRVTRDSRTAYSVKLYPTRTNILRPSQHRNMQQRGLERVNTIP